MSAWIEINSSLNSASDMSVALLVSAWIEIIFAQRHIPNSPVALLVSAWIEIPIQLADFQCWSKSHSS